MNILEIKINKCCDAFLIQFGVNSKHNTQTMSKKSDIKSYYFLFICHMEM